MKRPRRVVDRAALDLVKQRPCVICGHPSDPCHIKSKGSGGGDVLDNLLSLCRTHHIQQHAYGWSKLIDKNPSLKKVLSELGYELTDSFGVMKLRKK